MAYAVLTESDLLERAEGGGESYADRLAAALTAMEDEGFVLAGVDRAPDGVAHYVFHGERDVSRRLNNIR
jgi:hypothetical protein